MSVRLKLTLAYIAGLIATTIVLAIAVASSRSARTYEGVGRVAVATATLASRIVDAGVDRAGGKPIVWTDAADHTVLAQDVFDQLDVLPGYVAVSRDSVIVFTSGAFRDMRSEDWRTLRQGIRDLPTDGPAGVFQVAKGEVLLVAMSVSDTSSGVTRVIAGAPVEANGWSPELGSALLLICPIIILLSAFVAWTVWNGPFRRVARIRDEVSAITDGRSLHRRLSADGAGVELVGLIEAVNAMITRLENSFMALRRFTADASHELKTPLAVLRADVERAMEDKVGKNDRLVALEEALHEVTRMSDLVESLLTLARADEGRFQLHREPVDMKELVQEVYETALILGEAAGVTVALPFTADVTIMGDRGRLRQLFLNLVTNAIKYTAAGGRVDLGLGRHPTTVTFAVRDTGIGIAAADLPHVFERFWRADRVRTRTAERSGVGLGLAISQWIAQAHNGTLSVSSRLGRGSLFTVTLPAGDFTET